MLEHPATSRIWQCDPDYWCPMMTDLFPDAVLDTIHQCRYGALWRKPTNFYRINTKPAWEASLRTCPGGVFCSETGRPHERALQGRMCAKAAYYPQKLAEDIAFGLVGHAPTDGLPAPIVEDMDEV